MFDIVVKLSFKTFSILILGEHDSTSIKDEPPDNQRKIANDKDLLRVDGVVLLNVFIICVYQLDALIVFKLRKLIE